MTQTQNKRVYGWRPSLPDPRRQVADHAGMPVLSHVDPRNDPKFPEIVNQLELGACTANADEKLVRWDAILNGVNLPPQSRLDIYWGERKAEGTIASDAGAFGHDGLKYAQKVGTIPETDWPYDIEKFAETPPSDTAARHKIGTYKSVPRSMLAFQRVLSNRQLIAIGFSVFESFQSPGVARTGIMPVPDVSREKMLGGHEVVVVGYVTEWPNHALVANSWGVSWGRAGYFMMPWSIILDPNMSSDFRTIYRPQGK